MWRSRKFIIVAVLAAVVVVGSIGGIALADDNDSQPETLFDRVTAILVDEGVNITSEQLKDAFGQAQSDMQAAAMENRLAKMIENGVIDETQAKELQDWWDSRPDVSAGFGFKGHGGFRGMHGMRGFGGPCSPWNN